MAGMKLKKGDLVKVITGSNKGKTGKVVRVHTSENAVSVEGINVVKRHVKPNTLNPQGGIIEVHKPIDVSKVAFIADGSKGATSRIGYITSKDGTKKRVLRQAKNKEIDS